VGERKEPCENPAFIITVVDISPAIEILKFLFDRKELTNLV
jgi:hypothetical protein